MLSRPVGRAAQSSSPFVLSSACLKSAVAGPVAASKRPQHRRSSSKTSHPSGGAPPSARNSTQAEAASTKSQGGPSQDGPSQDKRRASATGASRRRSRTYAGGEDLASTHEVFANAPAVPPTSHLTISDVKLSSLFALHRPISINPSAAYPPSTSNKSFNAMFATPKPSGISNEIYTMAPQAQTHSAYQHEEADGLHFSVLQSSASNARSSDSAINLDEIPSLEEMARQYRPFHRPPPPVPFGDEFQLADQNVRESIANADDNIDALATTHAPNALRKRDNERTYTTTLTIKEATAADGQKTYTASASPIIEYRKGQDFARATEVHSRIVHQPFLTRMRARGVANELGRQERVETINREWETRTEIEASEGEQSAPAAREEDVEDLSREMLLISVKRRRQLKMKKHKYKKLMRRTRNIRRREGRL